MKIQPEHLEQLRAAIAPLDTEDTRAVYRERRFLRADRVKDINKRYRWDLLWATNLLIGDGVGVQGDINLYAYMNDNHIDTALREIVKPL